MSNIIFYIIKIPNTQLPKRVI